MNKEQIYDEKINPLMAQIIGICSEHKIAMFATFDIPNDDDPNLSCTTCQPDESGELPAHIAACKRLVWVESGRAPLMITTTRRDGSKTIAAVL